MKNFIFLSLLLCGLVALADDLPIESTLKRRLSNVEVYKVLEFQTKDVMVKIGPHQGKYSGILELKLAVEGNICGAEPDTFSFSLSYNKDFTEKNLKLFVSQPYIAEPTITKGCLLYSRSSTAIVELELQEYVSTGEKEEEIYIVPCLLYTSPSPRDRQKSRMPSSA